MASFIPLNKTEHLNKGWQRTTGLAFAKSETTVPVLIDEIPHLVTTMPIVFTRSEAAEHFELRALLSLQAGKNAFVSADGKWLIGYIPAEYRSYPFKAFSRSDSDRLTLCFNTDSGLMTDTPTSDSERFFDGNGEPTQFISNIITFLEKCERNRQFTQLAVDTLAKHKLLKPFKVALNDEAPTTLAGIYTIDEAAMRALSPDALAELNKANSLALAYAQLMSQHRLENFSKLDQLHELPTAAGEPNISGILSSNDGTLSFD
jgi:hypothetical protein